MPRLSRLGFVIALLGAPLPARGDGFRVPEDTDPVEATIEIVNLDAHPGHVFVLWPDACFGSDGSVEHTVLNVAADDGRLGFQEEPCSEQYVFAFPLDTYPLVDDALPASAAAQLRSEPPDDPRVLTRRLDARTVWYVPEDIELLGITDLYHASIEADVLRLTPIGVRFEFSGERHVQRAYYKGRRPPIPRAEDIPPEPTEPPADAAAPPPDSPAVAAPIAAMNSTSPMPATAPAPVAPVSEDRPHPPTAANDDAPAEISPSPWPPPPVAYGGLCLLVALAAGLALRRRA